jgi:hypothetical protein
MRNKDSLSGRSDFSDSDAYALCAESRQRLLFACVEGVMKSSEGEEGSDANEHDSWS